MLPSNNICFLPIYFSFLFILYYIKININAQQSWSNVKTWQKWGHFAFFNFKSLRKHSALTFSLFAILTEIWPLYKIYMLVIKLRLPEFEGSWSPVEALNCFGSNKSGSLNDSLINILSLAMTSSGHPSIRGVPVQCSAFTWVPGA